VAESEEVVADRGTAGNKRKRSKVDCTEPDEQEYRFKQQEGAFMERLDKLNRREVFQNRKIMRDPFETYFESLKAGDHEDTNEIAEVIDEIFAIRLNTIETTYEPEQRVSAKPYVHELQKEWKS
jgi:hypothetical protein